MVRSVSRMMEVRFVHHHDAGMLQRRLIDEIVMRVVAHLIDGDVVFRCVVGLRGARNDIEIDQRLERFDESFGVVGDPAARRRQGEKSTSRAKGATACLTASFIEPVRR